MYRDHEGEKLPAYATTSPSQLKFPAFKFWTSIKSNPTYLLFTYSIIYEDHAIFSGNAQRVINISEVKNFLFNRKFLRLYNNDALQVLRVSIFSI